MDLLIEGIKEYWVVALVGFLVGFVVVPCCVGWITAWLADKMNTK